VAIGLLIRPVQIELEIGAWLPRKTAASSPNGRVSVGLVNAALRACFRPRDNPLLVTPCGTFVAGDMYGQGTSLANSKSGSALWAAVLVGIWSGARINERWSLRIGFEGGPQLIGPTFVFDRGGRAFHPPPYGGRVSLGLETEW